MRNFIIKTLVLWSTVAVIIFGCASAAKLIPGGAVVANNAVTVASGLLHVLDGAYGGLLDMKLSPDYTVEATRALTIADAAAVALRGVIAGATITDAQLNLAAGQVEGARAILSQRKD